MSLPAASIEALAAAVFVLGWFADLYAPPLHGPVSPFKRLYVGVLARASVLGALDVAYTLVRALAALAGFVYWRDGAALEPYSRVLLAHAVSALALRCYWHALFVAHRPLFALAAGVLALLTSVGAAIGFALGGVHLAALATAPLVLWCLVALAAVVLFARALSAERRASTSASAATARANNAGPVNPLMRVERRSEPLGARRV